ncbi:MAG: excisionase [Actinomycetota bacterium]|nr:excisionase [Acidimicrobiia bacterium]MDQ3294015.1 excisionase [Actinomycetota bacterium]
MADWEARLEEWADDLRAAADADDHWVTLPEAEAECGVSRSALRNWYRSDQIQSRTLDGPHGPQRVVLLDEVEARAARSPRLARRAERELALEAQVVLLRSQLQALARRVEVLERPGGSRGRTPSG